MVHNTRPACLTNRDPISKFKNQGFFARGTFKFHNMFNCIFINEVSLELGELWLLIASESDTVFLHDSNKENAVFWRNQL